MNPREQAVADGFHTLYYDGPEGEGTTFMRTFWMNVPCLKCPLDLWIYQEIVAEVRPDLIVETGTHMGGSALYLAHILDIIGRGDVITIDTLEHPGRPSHPRISYVHGSSADPALIASVLGARSDETRLVILDSDHSRDHVLAELTLLAPFVTVGSYIIVEDTNINGHPACPSYGEGPYEAVEAFTRAHSNFVVDRSREKFLMTFNPRGYLRRVN